jgi:hypothetical protein
LIASYQGCQVFLTINNNICHQKQKNKPNDHNIHTNIKYPQNVSPFNYWRPIFGKLVCGKLICGKVIHRKLIWRKLISRKVICGKFICRKLISVKVICGKYLLKFSKNWKRTLHGECLHLGK